MVELNIFRRSLWCPGRHNCLSNGNDPYKCLILLNDSATNNKINLPNKRFPGLFPRSGNHSSARINRPFRLFLLLRESEAKTAAAGLEPGCPFGRGIRGQQQLVPHVPAGCRQD
jgi:hypothetical protein